MIVQVKQIDFHDLNPLPTVILLDPIPYALRYGIVKMSLGKYYITYTRPTFFSSKSMNIALNCHTRIVGKLGRDNVQVQETNP